jgi:hypothetical protein
MITDAEAKNGHHLSKIVMTSGSLFKKLLKNKMR